MKEQPRLSRRAVLGSVAAVAGAAATAPLFGSTPAVAAPPKVGWHPGHYVWRSSRAWDQKRMDDDVKFLQKYGDSPYIKGIKIGLGWKYFEAARGDYRSGFKIIDAYVDALSKLPTKKYLMVEIDTRTYTPYTSDTYPDYLADEMPGGGVVYAPKDTSYDGNTSIARIWEDKIMDRLIAMSRALADRYNSVSQFEMLSLGETTIPDSVPGYDSGKWVNSLKRWFAEGKAAWPNTQLRLEANWLNDDKTLAEMFDYIVNRTGSPGGVAIGGPDPELRKDDGSIRTIAANRVFRGEGKTANGTAVGTDLRKKCSWVGEVQGLGLGARIARPPKEIWQSEFSQMHAHYMVWLYNDYQPDPDVPLECFWEKKKPDGTLVGEWPTIQEIKAEIHLAPPTIGAWDTA